MCVSQDLDANNRQSEESEDHRTCEQQLHVLLLPHLDVAGLLHEPAGILCSSVTFRQLHSEELESPFKVRLQEVLFRCLEGDMTRRR